MPGDQCIVCNDKKRRPAIDGALQQGSTVADVSRRFHITHESVRRHTRDHLGIAGPSGRKHKLTKSVPTPPTPRTAAESDCESSREPVAIEPIRTPEAVTETLEWVISRSKVMHSQAEASGDWKLANTAMSQVVSAIDKIAQSLAMYQKGGTVINIDQRSQKVAAFYDALPTDVLRQLAAGEIRVEQLIDSMSESAR